MLKEVSTQTIPDRGTAHPVLNYLLHLSYKTVSFAEKNLVLTSCSSIPNSKTLGVLALSIRVVLYGNACIYGLLC